MAVEQTTVAHVEAGDLIVLQGCILRVEALGRNGKLIQLAGVDLEGRQTMFTAPSHMAVTRARVEEV